MSLKVGLVTGEYPPMEGGVGAFTQELARAMWAAGCQPHIITDRVARPRQRQRRLADLLQPMELDFAVLHPHVRGWGLSSLSTIVDVVVRYELDVVNVQYQAAAYNMRSAAINLLPWRMRGVAKTVVTFHDLRVPYLFPKAGWLRGWVVRLMARRAHGVIVTNEADAGVVSGWGVSAMAQIPIGSNIPAYEPEPMAVRAVREQFGLLPGDFLLGYFGFLNESKGADVLLLALAQLPPEVHLLFIGGQTGSSDPENNGQFLAGLHELIADLGLEGRVHWSGFVTEMEVSACLRAADLMVMPYRDGASLRRGTLMAVLAHGRPLITTMPVVPTSVLVHGENVWLVPVDDVPSVVTATTRLLADDFLRQRLGAGAAEVAGLFAWDGIAVRTMDFLEGLVRI